ncbi:MAG: insulinase family protein, partial [Defluviitaleaceae bacterium]|nr:insulinase family protein [Defluviitaleaceae bacterium]
MTNTIVIPTNKFSTNILCILIRRPLCREDVTSTALLPPILSRGSVSYPSVQEIRLAAESMQGSIFDVQIIKKGEYQILQFFIEFAAGAADNVTLKSQVLDFLQDVILHPLTENEGFFPAYVKGEKDNLRNRIQGRINNKAEYTNLKCLESMCKGEPFGLYGDGYEEDLPDITPKSLLSHYHNIQGNALVDFIALGTWNEEWLKEEISKRFNIFVNPTDTSNDSLAQAQQVKVKQAGSDRQIIQLDHGTSQGNLCVGLRCELEPSGKDAINLLLANEILGVGPGAKLFTNIREKESLCYSIYSNVYRFKSLMCVLAGAEPDKLEHVLALVEKEIDCLQKGEVSDSELHNAKQY